MTEPEGRAKGGLARAEALSPKARKAIAKKAAAARWDDDIPTATHIGEIEGDYAGLDRKSKSLSKWLRQGGAAFLVFLVCFGFPNGGVAKDQVTLSVGNKYLFGNLNHIASSKPEQNRREGQNDREDSQDNIMLLLDEVTKTPLADIRRSQEKGDLFLKGLLACGVLGLLYAALKRC